MVAWVGLMVTGMGCMGEGSGSTVGDSAVPAPEGVFCTWSGSLAAAAAAGVPWAGSPSLEVLSLIGE